MKWRTPKKKKRKLMHSIIYNYLFIKRKGEMKMMCDLKENKLYYTIKYTFDWNTSSSSSSTCHWRTRKERKKREKNLYIKFKMTCDQIKSKSNEQQKVEKIARYMVNFSCYLIFNFQNFAFFVLTKYIQKSKKDVEQRSPRSRNYPHLVL